MKTYKTYKIGTAALAAVLVLGIGSCAHHRKKPAAPPAPVSQPTAQATVLEAPKSLEGAWIKVKSHHSSEPVGANTRWWYVENGKPYYYGDEACSGEHPATPASLGTPQYFPGAAIPLYEDSMGREYQLAEMSYHPRGKKATLKIVNFNRDQTTLCRYATVKDGWFALSKAPAAEITFTSVHAGVYHGTIKGIYSVDDRPADSDYDRLDSITIYTE